MKVVRSSPLRTGRLYPQEYPGTHFQRLSRPQGTWNCLMPRKKSPVTGDRSRDPPTRTVWKFSPEILMKNWGDIFKPTDSDERLQETNSISDNSVRIVNLFKPKCYLSREGKCSLLRNFHKYYWKPPDGKNKDPVYCSLIDRRWHTWCTIFLEMWLWYWPLSGSCRSWHDTVCQETWSINVWNWEIRSQEVECGS